MTCDMLKHFLWLTYILRPKLGKQDLIKILMYCILIYLGDKLNIFSFVVIHVNTTNILSNIKSKWGIMENGIIHQQREQLTYH